MHYSLPLASWLSKHDYGLYGKNDLRFVEGVYKVEPEEISVREVQRSPSRYMSSFQRVLCTGAGTDEMKMCSGVLISEGVMHTGFNDVGI